MPTEYMLRRRAEALFNSPDVPAATNVAYRERWVRMVLWLGPRWLGLPQPKSPRPSCFRVST
jgi:hypothetical protein